MKITVLLAALCAVLFVSNADAGPKHKLGHTESISGCSDPVMRPCGGGAQKDRQIRFERKYAVQARHIAARAESQKTRRAPPGLRRVMAEGAGRVVAPARFIHGRLICALNVGAALAARGIRGTGSRLAKSYLHWGHASGPVPGAVAVFNRRGGGHVAIVHHVRPDGTVIYLNPSSRRQAWQVGPYSRKPIAYRVAGGW